MHLENGRADLGADSITRAEVLVDPDLHGINLFGSSAIQPLLLGLRPAAPDVDGGGVSIGVHGYPFSGGSQSVPPLRGGTCLLYLTCPRGRTTNNFYPVCVVPKMIAPVRGHSKFQGF